jgi:MYXO-CTERM domain-containing protein
MRARTILVALSVLPSLASAQTYTSQFAFLGAVHSGYTVESNGFESFALNQQLPDGSTLPGSYSSATLSGFTPGTVGRVDNAYVHNGQHGLGVADLWDPFGADFFLPDEGVTLTFSQPVYGFGAFFGLGTSAAGQYGIEAGSLTAGNATQCGSLCFVGLMSSTPFSSAYLGGFGTGQSGFVLDDLRWVIQTPTPPTPVDVPPVTSTPEPTTLALAGLGLAALFLHRRRRTA